MKRFGQVVKVKPEKFAEYKKLHYEIWPGIVEKTHAVNIQNYTIFERDGYMFAYFEYTGTNYEEDMKKLENDEEYLRWMSLTDACQESLDENKKFDMWVDLEEIFHM